MKKYSYVVDYGQGGQQRCPNIREVGAFIAHMLSSEKEVITVSIRRVKKTK